MFTFFFEVVVRITETIIEAESVVQFTDLGTVVVGQKELAFDPAEGFSEPDVVIPAEAHLVHIFR